MSMNPAVSAVPMPSLIAALPTHRGFPIPWFVAWDDGKPLFEYMREGAVQDAAMRGLCWVCGQPRWLSRSAYVAGPMCGINRVSAEPPSHVLCARYAAKVCPFLARPHAKRREADERTVEAAGVMLKRNPGVTMLWIVGGPLTVDQLPNGWLFDIGEPWRVEWWREGRLATRGEVLDSIRLGLPALAEAAEQDGPAAVAALAEQHEALRPWLPPANGGGSDA